MGKVRVLIVDDSPTMRLMITSILQRDPEIEVVGAVGDPFEARVAIKDLNPDVITLDIEMPKMNGIEFLEKIMRLRPMPVVMVSTLTQQGAEATLTALELGAVDCVGKPGSVKDLAAFEELATKVKIAAAAKVRPLGERTAAPRAQAGAFRSNGRLVAVGASTGGVEALTTLLSEFPANCPPTVVTQHMPPAFTESFAARLDKLCAPSVTQAVDGAMLSAGSVVIAPGGERHLEVTAATGGYRCRLREGPTISGHRPSVDALFQSVAEAAGARAVGVILTGMGADGAKGLLAMREAGAKTFGQDEASCVIYGMPKVAFELGAVERQVPLTRMARAVLDVCTASASEKAL
ncbi:MAG: chemotaxis response regulator protein-glutamate methylesterase [Phenylobacterium sp.]